MSSNAAARARGATPPRSLSIGQVLQRLGGEFPDLSPSKLRFLEEKGLVAPDRSPKGYRKFSGDDVERIRLILTMQRDHYLPLKVIGEYLDAVDAGLSPELPGSRATGHPSMLPAEVVLDRAELLRRAEASAALLDDAISAGLIRAGARYDEDDLTMLRTLTELERSGIGPRHLRSFRTAAAHEAGLIDQAVGPAAGRGDVASRELAREQADALMGSLELVRHVLLRQAIRGTFPRVAGPSGGR